MKFSISVCKECNALALSALNVSLDINTVPDVPSDILQLHTSPTVAVPIAAAALSPAPAAIFTSF